MNDDFKKCLYKIIQKEKNNTLVQVKNNLNSSKPFVIPYKNLLEICANHAHGCSRLQQKLSKAH